MLCLTVGRRLVPAQVLLEPSCNLVDAWVVNQTLRNVDDLVSPLLEQSEFGTYGASPHGKPHPMPVAVTLAGDDFQVAHAHLLGPISETTFGALRKAWRTKVGTTRARGTMTAIESGFGRRKLWSMLPSRADVASPNGAGLVGSHEAA